MFSADNANQLKLLELTILYNYMLIQK